MRGITPGFGTNAAQEKESETLSLHHVRSGSQIQGQSFEKFGMSPGEWRPKNKE